MPTLRRAVAPVMRAVEMVKRTGLLRVALLALVLPAAAAAQLQPAVQPGGDIPTGSRTPPPPRSPPWRTAVPGLAYERREVTIPMRDGVRLHAVLIIPRDRGHVPIMLDRTPYSADKAAGRAPPG